MLTFNISWEEFVDSPGPAHIGVHFAANTGWAEVDHCIVADVVVVDLGSLKFLPLFINLKWRVDFGSLGSDALNWGNQLEKRVGLLK